jgi:CBS domain-containing protein
MPSTSVRRAGQPHHTERGGDHLQIPVRDVMTPGVVTISEDASLLQALRAIRAHDVHAILVVGAREQKPIGWITVDGLLDWIGKDPTLLSARDAVSELPTVIDPLASTRDALSALTQPETQHLLVCRRPDGAPEGVVTAVNLVTLEHG